MSDNKAQKNKMFSCFIIGETSLSIQCAEILLQSGHQIFGMISAETQIQRWAEEKGISHFEPDHGLADILSRQPFDYLFSIVYSHVIPAEVLTMPQKFPINWHDGPLPRYAGIYATSWALINREKRHAVTWHVMRDGVDEGEILKQRSVEIADNDTAFTLNAKCYEAAIDSFKELVNELVDNGVKFGKQDLTERTYFAKYKRPPGAGTIYWKRTADELDAFVRALDFGPQYVNPLGLPKLVIGSDVFFVPEIKILDTDSRSDPGTLIAADGNYLRVATESKDIGISKLLSYNGQPMSIADFLTKYGIRQGDKLPELDQMTTDRLSTLNGQICRHETFWVNRLAKLENIEIPYTNHNLVPNGPTQYAIEPMPIPVEVNNLSSQHDDEKTGRGVWLATAIASFLARLTGKYTYDISLSYPALRKEIEGFEGFFATHVPWHIEIDPSAGFNSSHDVLQAGVALIIKNKTYARDTVMRYPELGSIQGCDIQSVLPISLELLGSFEDFQPITGTRLTILVSTDGKECQWAYDTTIFDREGIHHLQQQFTTFLRNIVTSSDHPVSAIPILNEAERHQILVEWNDTRVDYPQDKLVHQIFEAQAEKTPDSIAVVFEGESLTYRELNERANQLAHYLQSLGVGPESMVGIAVERSLEMIVGLYSILKAGGAYVPLDPTYPADRIAYMMEDASVPVLLTQQRLLDKLPPHKAQVVCLDIDWDRLIGTHNTENPACRTTLENLAYMIYTSGSTGKPKGAMNNHGGILNRLLWMQDAYKLTDADAVLQKTPFSFDVSVWEFFWPLMFGARLVVARPEGHKDSDYLVKTIVEQKITTMHFVPSMLQIFLMAKEVEKCTSLRQVVCSGEALPLELQNRFFDKLNAQLHNLYGPTEAAVDVTYWECRRDSQLKIVPIGCPVANTQMYILDGNLQPVPVGVSGELFIGGVQVGRGYHNRPELTAEKFIPDPFSNDSKSRLYRTGDSCCYLSDGNIEYLGRLDFQVKIRGNRIELGEIESLLGQHPEVREVVVTAREDIPGDKRLAAYIISNRDKKVAAGELRDWVMQKLPDFMVPSYFVNMDKLPLTPNQKVDRKALPAPEISREPETAYVPPGNELQQTIARMWGEALNIPRVGINDNFFELGGHSLLLVKVYYRLSEIIDREFSITDMFRFPTISSLAQCLTQEQKPEPSLAAARELARKQRESLKPRRKISTTRR
jgi:amino acid adenylation domain-containing protein